MGNESLSSETRTVEVLVISHVVAFEIELFFCDDLEPELDFQCKLFEFVLHIVLFLFVLLSKSQLALQILD